MTPRLLSCCVLLLASSAAAAQIGVSGRVWRDFDLDGLRTPDDLP